MSGANKRVDSPSSYVRECISLLEAAEAEQQASTHSPLAQVCLFIVHNKGGRRLISVL